MKNCFLSNTSETTFLAHIKDNLRRCHGFSFSVSFIKKAGLVLLYKDIEAAVERGCVGRIITSTYLSCFSQLAWLLLSSIQLGCLNGKKKNLFKQGRYESESGNPAATIYLTAGVEGIIQICQRIKDNLLKQNCLYQTNRERVGIIHMSRGKPTHPVLGKLGHP